MTVTKKQFETEQFKSVLIYRFHRQICPSSFCHQSPLVALRTSNYWRWQKQNLRLLLLLLLSSSSILYLQSRKSEGGALFCFLIFDPHLANLLMISVYHNLYNLIYELPVTCKLQNRYKISNNIVFSQTLTLFYQI